MKLSRIALLSCITILLAFSCLFTFLDFSKSRTGIVFAVTGGNGVSADANESGWGKIEVVIGGVPTEIKWGEVARNDFANVPFIVRITANRHYAIDSVKIGNDAPIIVNKDIYETTSQEFFNSNVYYYNAVFIVKPYSIEVDSVDETGAKAFELTNKYTTEGSVKLGGSLKLTNIGAPTGYRFVYSYIDYGIGTQVIGVDDVMTLATFSPENLDLYLDNNKIKIVAVYARQCMLGITINNSQVDPTKITLSVSSPVLVLDDRFLALSNTTHTISTNNEVIYLDKGSQVFIQKAEDDGVHKFVAAKRDGVEVENFKLDGNTTLEFIYETDVYKIKFTGMTEEGQNIDLSNSIEIANGNIAQMGQTKQISFSGLEGFKFVNFSMKRNAEVNNSWEKIESINENFELIVDELFVDEFVKNLGGEYVIEVVVYLSAKYRVTINIIGQEDIIDKDSFELFDITNNKIVAGDTYFEPETQIRITANDSSFSIYGAYDEGTLSNDDLQIGRELVFTITGNRIINIQYDAKMFGLLTNNNIESFTFSNDAQEFKVGDHIVISFDVPSNHDVKNFKINGKNFTSSINGNTVSIKVTTELLADASWFDGDNIIVNYSVATSLKPEILLAYLLPSIFIPLIILILLVLFIINARRKAIIRKQLVGERADKMKRNVGGYISDLRDGNITSGVSKEDVKSAMKASKESKSKDKPAKKPKPEKQVKVKEEIKLEPAPISSSVPGVPNFSGVNRSFNQSPAPVNLVGTTLTRERTFTNAQGTVVARLQQDFTIVDMSGKQIASARMSDGKIVSPSGSIIGSISGNGTII